MRAVVNMSIHQALDARCGLPRPQVVLGIATLKMRLLAALLVCRPDQQVRNESRQTNGAYNWSNNRVFELLSSSNSIRETEDRLQSHHHPLQQQAADGSSAWKCFVCPPVQVAFVTVQASSVEISWESLRSIVGCRRSTQKSFKMSWWNASS